MMQLIESGAFGLKVIPPRDLSQHSFKECSSVYQFDDWLSVTGSTLILHAHDIHTGGNLVIKVLIQPWLCEAEQERIILTELNGRCGVIKLLDWFWLPSYRCY